MFTEVGTMARASSFHHFEEIGGKPVEMKGYNPNEVMIEVFPKSVKVSRWAPDFITGIVYQVGMTRQEGNEDFTKMIQVYNPVGTIEKSKSGKAWNIRITHYDHGNIKLNKPWTFCVPVSATENLLDGKVESVKVSEY